MRVISKHVEGNFKTCYQLEEIICFINMENLCVICGIRKSTKAQLDKHIIEYHNGRSFSCDVCQKQCFGRKGLQNHMKTHQLINCNICSKECKS